MKLTPGHESAKLHCAVVQHNYSRRKGTKLPQLACWTTPDGRIAPKACSHARRRPHNSGLSHWHRTCLPSTPL